MRHILLTAGLLAMGSSDLASAQIVNIQNALSGKMPDGPALDLELRQEKKTGNTESDRYAAQSTATYKKEQHLVLGLLKREYGKEGSEQVADSKFLHLRYGYTFTELFAWELFVQEDADRFRRRESRSIYGTGPRFQLYQSDSLGVAFSIAAMQERERISPLVDVEGGEVRNLTRISNTLAVAWKMDDYVSLSDVLYYQPATQDIDNRRILNEAALNIKINELLTLKTSHTLSYDSTPPTQVKPQDTTLRQAIVISL